MNPIGHSMSDNSKNKNTTKQVPLPLAPVESLIRKLEKVRGKLRAGSGLEKRVRGQINALQYARERMAGVGNAGREITNSERQEMVRVITAMIHTTQKMRKKFAVGTAQHTLLRNRLAGLRAARAALRATAPAG